MKLIKKVKLNKKNIIVATVIIIVIIAIAAAYGLRKKSDSINTGKAKAVSTEQKKEAKKTNTGANKKDIAENSETKAKSEDKAETEKKDDNDEKTAKSENKASKSLSGNTGTSNSNGSSSVSQGSSSSTASSGSSSQPKRWVVDKPAWDEVVTKYRTEIVTKYYCGGRYFETYEEGYAYYLEAGADAGSLSPVNVEVQVPYTETIHHDEVGHWE
ncbi:MAG: hypothetical protein SPI74_00540 [Eubacterium sp.]|nr:hypothetical protein [Eubacterium sp.]